MKKIILLLLGSMLCWFLVAATPSQAVNTASASTAAASVQSAPATVSTAQSCSAQPDGKCYWYNGYHWYPYNYPNLCAQNNIGVFWNIETAANAFESGTNTVNIAYRRLNNTASCADSGYPNSRIFTLTTYNYADGFCSKVTGNNNNGLWTGSVVVWMNLHYGSCYDSQQRKNNEISNAIGTVLGLSFFSSSTHLTAAVMNSYFRNSYNYAGSDDRNALYWLY